MAFLWLRAGLRTLGLGVFFALWCSACDNGPTTVLVTVNGPSSVAAVDVDVTLGTGARVQRTLPLGDGKMLPGLVHVELPDVVTSVTVRATATIGGVEATDEKTVTSKLHRQVKVTLQLGDVADMNVDPLPDLTGADLTGADLTTPPPADLETGPSPDLNGVPAVEVAIGNYGGGGNFDGVAGDARFETLNSLVVVGNTAYIGEYWSGVLRTVDLTTMQAGRVALTRASDGLETGVSYPTGATYDGAGFMYLTSFLGNLVQKVELATGKVTRIAGQNNVTGSADGDAATATFNHPVYTAFDSMGNLWVADQGNKKLRKIQLTPSVMVSTPALSTGVDMGAPATITQIGGMRIDNDQLYFSDEGGIKKIDLTTTPLVVTQFVPKNKLQSIADIAIVGTDLFALDGQLNTVWRFPLANPASGVMIAGGNSFAGYTVDGVATSARFQNPCCIVPDGAGSLYIAEPYTLRKLAISTVAVTTLAGRGANVGNTPPLLNRPHGIYYDGSDAVYIGDAGSNRVRKFVLSTQTLTNYAGSGDYDWADGHGTAAKMYGPTGIIGDKDGNLYVSDAGNACLRKIDPAGQVTTIVGHPKMDGAAPMTDNMNGADVYLGNPMGLAYDGNQTLYLADLGNNVVLTISLADTTYKTSVLAGNPTQSGHVDAMGKAARFEGPRALAYDGAHQRLYVSDINSDTLRRVDLTNAMVSTISGIAYSPFTSNIPAGDNGSLGGTRHRSPSGLVLLPGGDELLLANEDGHTIQRINVTGDSSSTVIGSAMQGFVKPGALPARIQNPVGMTAVGKQLFIVSENENVVLKVSGVLP